MLDRKFGKLPSRTQKSIAALELTKLEELAIALLDFQTIPVPGVYANDNLKAWLKNLQIDRTPKTSDRFSVLRGDDRCVHGNSLLNLRYHA
jgi:Domain of unknown function (DUF4351)